MSKAIKSITGAIGGLFKTPDLDPVKPTPMPDPNSAAAKLAAVKKARARSSRGREGTIYSAYSGNNLGGTA